MSDETPREVLASLMDRFRTGEINLDHIMDGYALGMASQSLNRLTFLLADTVWREQLLARLAAIEGRIAKLEGAP